MTTAASSPSDRGGELVWIPAAVAAVAIGTLGIATVGAAHLSTLAFLLLGAGLVVLLGVAALRWPRAILVALVLSPPLVDLYATQNLLPVAARDMARFFSEGLLVVIAAILVVVSARRRTLVSAVRHPFSLGLAVFLAVSALSAVVNAVPPVVAASAMIFTLDAAVLFYLPRMVGYTHHQLHRTMWAAAIVVAIASVIAILQALLTPSLLGITPVVGQSGEGVRMGSLVADPNILGTIIGMALPFTIFSLVRTPPGRRRWLILGAALAMGLALVLTYSRGSWIGAAIGLGGVALIIDRRAFVAFALIMVVAYGTAVVMPKGLLTGGAVSLDPVQSTINRIGAIGEMRDLRALFVANGLPILEDNPVLGVGPGRYGGAAASVFGSPIHDRFKTDRLLTNQETVDNFWLHLGVEGGVAGIAAFLAMIGVALWAPIRAFRRTAGSRFSVPAGIVSGVVTVVVAVFTTMLLEGNTAAFLFWFLLGLGSMTLPAAVRTGDRPAAATACGG